MPLRIPRFPPSANAAPLLPLVGAPAPRGAKWLDLEAASQRSGIPVRTLRHRCGKEWLAQGLAKTRPSVKGRRPQWHVREDADAALMRVQFPGQLPFDLRQVPESARRVVLLRKRVIDDSGRALQGRARGLNEHAATERFLDAADYGIALCRATLYNWRREYRASDLAGLLDRRSVRTAAGNGDGNGQADPFLDEVKRLWLRPQKLKLSSCHEMASVLAADHGWPMHSYEVCRRFIKAIPAAVVYKCRYGEDAFVDKAEPYIERDCSTLRSNEIWCGDHHHLDVIVAHHGKHLRPWLTAWMDMRSRKIVGWQMFACDPNTDTILAAFENGARTCGLPESVYVDNGADFNCYALHGRTKRERRRGTRIDENRAKGVFAGLDVAVHFCWAYHGQSKPIERFFGTLANDARVWNTHCGSNTADKPEDLAKNLRRGKAPALDELTEWVAAWLGTYHASEHGGGAMDGRSPDQVFAENLKQKRTASAEMLDVLLMKQSRTAKVGQNGVTYEGLRYGAGDPALLQYLGKGVVLRIDPKDVSRVDVWTLADRFICHAHANQRLPANASAEELKEAIAEKKRTRKAVRDYIQQRPRLHEDLPDLMLRARAAKSLPPPSAAAPVETPIRTPVEDQLPALRRALDAEKPRGGFTYKPREDTAEKEEDGRFHYSSGDERRLSWAEFGEALRRDQEPARPERPRLSFAEFGEALRENEEAAPRTPSLSEPLAPLKKGRAS